MLRDKNLIPLSRQHQHALALCVRIERASPILLADLGAWQSEIAQHFRTEIRIHFVAEEQFIFPVAAQIPDLNSLVEELLNDHSWLRNKFERAETQKLSSGEIAEFSKRLSDHIRNEERQLFEKLQQLMSNEELSILGAQLDQALTHAEQTCALPARNIQQS